MKRVRKKVTKDDFIAPACHALRRPARKIRAENRRLGLPLIAGENGKIVEKRAKAKFVKPPLCLWGEW